MPPPPRNDHETGLLHAAVLGRRAGSWIHGQVVRLKGRDLVVMYGDHEIVSCRASAVHRIDPVIALLFGVAVLAPSLELADVKAAHAAVLSRLLGDPEQPRSRPTRDIAKLFHGIVEAEAIPYGSKACTWTTAEHEAIYVFPLQHAVDHAFVTESSAKRISKLVRDSVGEAFYAPPARAVSSRQRCATADSFLDPDSDREPATGSIDIAATIRHEPTTSAAKRPRVDSSSERTEEPNKKTFQSFVCPPTNRPPDDL